MAPLNALVCRHGHPLNSRTARVYVRTLPSGNKSVRRVCRACEQKRWRVK